MLQKFISNLSDKEKKIFYIAAIVIGMMLLDRLFLGPILAHVKRLDGEIEKQKTNIVRDRRILTYEDKIKKESEAFSRYVFNSVPDDDVVNAAFLRLIESLATQSKVNLVKSNPSHITRNDQVNEYFASVDCEGKLPDVIAFMHTVNTSDDMLKVAQFNLTPKRGVENEVKASMTVVKTIVH